MPAPGSHRLSTLAPAILTALKPRRRNPGTIPDPPRIASFRGLGLAFGLALAALEFGFQGGADDIGPRLGRNQHSIKPGSGPNREARRPLGRPSRCRSPTSRMTAQRRPRRRKPAAPKDDGLMSGAGKAQRWGWAFPIRIAGTCVENAGNLTCLARIRRRPGVLHAPSLALHQPKGIPPAPRQVVTKPPFSDPSRKRRHVDPLGGQRLVSDLTLQARRARQRNGRRRQLEATGDRLAPRQAHQGNEGERPDQL